MHEADNPESRTSSPHLVRQLGLWSAVAVVVGSTIGSGIFRSPKDIAALVPSPIWLLAVWLVGGLFALCGALTLSEVGGAFPYSGGLYVYIREAYGRIPGFLFGWAQLVMIRPASLGAVAITFSEFFLRLFHIDSSTEGFGRLSIYVAVAAILLTGVANYRGVSFGAGIQNVTTVLKCAGLVVLVLLAFVVGLPKTGGHFASTPEMPGFKLSAFGLAIIAVLWAYDGWADASYVGGEVANPRKNVPRSIFLGTLIIVIVYMLANVGYLAVFESAAISRSQLVAADVMEVLIGGTGLVFIVATVMLSTFGTLNGTMLTSPRIFFALAEDKLFFEPVSRVHPRFKTPYVSILLTILLGTAYVSLGSFQQLAEIFVIAMVPFYALAVGSVFVFRAREKKGGSNDAVGELPDSLVDPIRPGHPESHPHRYEPPVRTPLYPVVPLLFIASALFLIGNSLFDADSRKKTFITLGVIAFGVPVYFATVGRARRS